VGREDNFKPTIGDESVHQDSNDNSIRIGKFITSKILVVKSTMFLHRNIHTYTWTNADRKTHNQTDHIWMDRKWYSGILDILSFRGADCGTVHYVVVAKIRQLLAVSKLAAKTFVVEDLISGH
jgi:hypothetical protein